MSKLATITSPSNYQAAVGRLTVAQLADRQTWGVIPDDELVLASLHEIRVRPAGSTTVTELNPTDPGTTFDSDGVRATGWLQRPGHAGRSVPARRP